MPVVITTPPPRPSPNAALDEGVLPSAWARARRALPDARRWLLEARRSLPDARRLLPGAQRLLGGTRRMLISARGSLPARQRLFAPAQRAWPNAERWAREKLSTVPWSVVVAAPFVVLLVLWLARGVEARHERAIAASRPAAQAVQSLPAAVAAHPGPAAPVLSAPAPSTGAPALADSAEARQALSQGLPAMEALAARYAADPEVLIALASAEAQAERYEAAIASIERALAAAPSSAQNGKVMGILWRAAQSSAAEESFACLRKLGRRGSDVEFDLATTPGVREGVRKRARAELTGFLALDASADTRAATLLLLAPDCAARSALLERAEQDGGKRTLAMLDRFSRDADCTPSAETECNACLRGSPVLARAIAKLRAGAKP